MTKWNVMLYLAGDNNLSEEMIWAIQQIQDADIGESVISAQFDPRGNGIPVLRYTIKRENGKTEISGPEKVPSEPPEDFSDARNAAGIKRRESYNREDTGNPTTLLEFVWWATCNATGKDARNKGTDSLEKAKEWNHMLVLSGHGSGTDGDFLEDDTTQESLTVQQLDQVLKDCTQIMFGETTKKKIDIVAMDSCLMSTAEVYYQIKDSANILVASEGYEPNSGWPYSVILNKLTDDPEAAANKIVEDYARFYSGYAIAGQSVDLSACRTRACDKLKDGMTVLADKLKTAVTKPLLADAIVLSHWKAQTYKSDQYIDLQDFAERLIVTCQSIAAKEADTNDVVTACDGVIQALKEIVVNSLYVGPAFQHSHGLSVYFPWSYVASSYIPPDGVEPQKCLKFPKDTHWHEFLAEYVRRTRPGVREGFTPSGLMRAAMSNTSGTQGVDPVPDSVRSTVGYNRSTVGYNRGKPVFISMKNPPIGWKQSCAICLDMPPATTGDCDKKQKPQNCRLKSAG